MSRSIIGRQARARFAGRCPLCQGAFAAGATLYRVARERGAWCSVPCRSKTNAPAKPTPSKPAGEDWTGGRTTLDGNVHGLNGTVRWVSGPLELAAETPAAWHDFETGTQSQESWGDAVKRLRDGDDRPAMLAAIDRGRELGRKLALPKTERMRWELDAVGCMPSVPHYLAGCERTMLRPRCHAEDTAPLRLWVSTAASWMATEEEQIERGAVLAGVLDMLATVRPVELIPFSVQQDDAGTAAIAWRADPRDGARLAAMLGQSSGRGIIMRWRFAHGNRANRTMWTDEASGARERRIFGIPDGDLVVRSFLPASTGQTEMGTAQSDLAEFLGS